MKVLVINAGSSSIKYKLFEVTKEISITLAFGIAERIGALNSRLRYRLGNLKFVKRVKLQNHRKALSQIFKILVDTDIGVIGSLKEIAAVGHRVVHGGEKFKHSCLITSKVLRIIEEHRRLAPLHNPPNILCIKICRDHFPRIPQAAVFDTSFHQTIPPKAYMYGLPYEFYSRYGIRRYGFHGTSHRYVAMCAAKILGRPLKRLKIISCHLGNGCSITAIEKGKSIDTSMGFTPLEGLVMGTRCGDIDPTIPLFLIKKGYSPDKIERILNNKSGLRGLSGISNDMRDIERESRRSKKRAKIALDVFTYRIEKYIGAYTAIMDGLDVLIFTAGIGENQASIRKRICANMSSLLKRFETKVMVIPTNEELMIARDTYAIAKTKSR